MDKFLRNKINDIKFKLNGATHILMASSNSDSRSKDPTEEQAMEKTHEENRKEEGFRIKKPSSNQIPYKEKEGHGCELQTERSTGSFEEAVMFRCPELGDEILSSREWKLRFREQLSKLKETDEILAAILAIRSLNPISEADQCVNVLEKYVRNLMDHPDNDKYRCIRLGNQILNEKVINIEGGLDFLLSIGFKTAVGGKDNLEPFLVYSPNTTNDLESIVKSLKSVTGFELELERDMRIIFPEEASDKNEETDEFYRWTLKDMRKEHKFREDERERKSQFRRKNRRSESKTGKGDISYTRIRVKFPDGVTVEAVFSINETLYSLKSLLLSQFYFYENFSFMSVPSRVFNVLDEERTFANLELFPNATLMLKWEKNSSGEKYAMKEKT